MSSGKVKCTCGWSWNKSDSSKKDMYICHECGRDNSNNMKNGGWLDNYNDSEVSLPEGYVGEGYNTSGRDYSPAWGGQFEDGGLIPMAQKGKKVKPIYVESKNDPRYKAYQDSLRMYNYAQLQKQVEGVKNYTRGYNPPGFFGPDHADFEKHNLKALDDKTLEKLHKIYKDEKDGHYSKMTISQFKDVTKKMYNKANEITKSPNIAYINNASSPDLIAKNNDPIATYFGLGLNYDYAQPNQPIEVKKKETPKPTTTKETTKSKPITKPQQKEVNVKPQLQPRVEALNLRPIEQAPINIPVQELDFNAPIKAPKSYNVSSQRTNVNGINDFYNNVQQGVDYEQALKSKQAADAYNKYIQEKYGNEDALKNPKAVERLKQLKQNVEIVPQYQMGGKLTFLQPTSEKLPQGYRIPYADPSSELAMSIGGEDGEPAYLIPSFKYGRPLENPMEEFKKTGEHLGGPFKTWQEADQWEQEVRHPYVEKGKAIPMPIKTWGEMAMGGSIPGSVGFTYARTNSPAPSNGKYAKKTMASAQDGNKTPKLDTTKLDFSIPKSTGYAWADEKLKKQKKALDEFKKVKTKVDTEVKKIQKKHNVSESTAREVYKRQQGLSEQQQPEEVRQYTPQSTLSKVKEIALNPMTAAGYKVRNEDIPENFSRSEDTRNNLDTAVDFINPAWYAESAKNLVQNQGQVFSDLSEGNFQDAALNQTMAGVEALNFIPLVKGAKPLLNKGMQRLGNIKTSVAPELREGLQTNGFLDIFKSKPKSEINWGNWNKEIPENPQLIKEYNAIEQKTKANGTWMKYSDGSDFNGTPEQFIQMKHPNTQKFAGGIKETEQMYKQPLYRGAHRHIVDFKNRDRNDFATFLTDSEKNAETYATSDGGVKKYFHPDIDKEVEAYGKFYPLEVDGKYQLSFPQNLPTVEGKANGNNWRFLDYDKKIDADGIRAEINRNSFEHNLGEKKQYQYDYPENFDINKNYLSTDDYANYVKNNSTGIAKIENVKDQMGYVEGIPANTVYAVDAEKVPIKSLMYNNGMFDMTNPNIYKSVLPIGLGVGAASQMGEEEPLPEMKQGGIIKDDRGQWAHPGEITEIGSNQITMQGVPYDVLGISDEGDIKLMKPGKDYKFKGKKVTEYPMAKNGIRQEQKGLVNLDQLTNFTNYNTKQPGGWMDKYQ